jgi:hypothetical protein
MEKKLKWTGKSRAVIGCTVHEGGWFSDKTMYYLPHHRNHSRSDPHPASYPTSNRHVLPRVKRPEPQTSAEIKNPRNSITRTLRLTLIKKINSRKVLLDLSKSGWPWGQKAALTCKINQNGRKGYKGHSKESPSLNIIKPTKIECSNGWEPRSVNRS